jgi:hypothetical protein
LSATVPWETEAVGRRREKNECGGGRIEENERQNITEWATYGMDDRDSIFFFATASRQALEPTQVSHPLSKTKVVPVLLTEYHAMKVYWGVEV